MTADLRALSRQELAARLAHETSRGCGYFVAGIGQESARRIREDGKRIEELKSQVMTLEQRIRELEALLAANSKGEAPIAVGDWVEDKHSGFLCMVNIYTPEQSPSYRITASSGWSAWRDAHELTRIPTPAPSEPDADGTLHDRIHPTSGKLLHASPVLPTADSKPAKPCGAMATGERRYGAQPGYWGGETLGEVLLYPREDRDRDLAQHLQSVLAGVAEVASELGELTVAMTRTYEISMDDARDLVDQLGVKLRGLL